MSLSLIEVDPVVGSKTGEAGAISISLLEGTMTFLNYEDKTEKVANNMVKSLVEEDLHIASRESCHACRNRERADQVASLLVLSGSFLAGAVSNGPVVCVERSLPLRVFLSDLADRRSRFKE